MTGINGVSAYQQTKEAWNTGRTQSSERTSKTAPAKAGAAGVEKETGKSAKAWSPINPASSMVPMKTEYGYTIGEVKLSDKAKDYYEELKAKYHNLEFIAVSKDMKEQVKKNASSYGNANRMVVLIDEEKLERMATDESFRKKYEGIIAMAQSKMTEAKNSLATSGANVKNFGITVDENGNEKFFAVLEKSSKLQKERIQKHAEEKREAKKAEAKAAKAKAEEARAEKAKAKAAEAEAAEADTETVGEDDREYVVFEADSMDELISKVSGYSYGLASANVRTEEELMRGTAIDYKG